MVPCPISDKIHSCGINEKVKYKFITKTRDWTLTKFIFCCMKSGIYYMIYLTRLIIMFIVGVIIAIS